MTIKTIIAKHRETLDEKWKKKFPDGQYYWYKTKFNETIYGKLLERPTSYTQVVDKALSCGLYVGKSFHTVNKHRIFSDINKWKEWIDKQTKQ